MINTLIAAICWWWHDLCFDMSMSYNSSHPHDSLVWWERVEAHWDGNGLMGRIFGSD